MNQDINYKTVLLKIPIGDIHIACNEAERLDSRFKNVLLNWIHEKAEENKHKLNEQVNKALNDLLNDCNKRRIV